MDDFASAGSVTVGRYELALGAPVGTLIAADGQTGEPPQALARALREKASGLVDSASEATARVEGVTGLVKDVLEGALVDPRRASADADLLLELFQRLIKEGRLAEALRVARTLNGALALLMRWVDLVRMLRHALTAAQRIADRDAIAWVHHELGTLHLAAQAPAAAQEHLEQARTIRRELGDEEGLAATEHNLVHLCRQLREMCREGHFNAASSRRKRLLALAAAVILCFFIVGTVAAAIGDRSPSRPELITWVDGRGTVVSDPDGIACSGGRCEHGFDHGQHVTLTPTARHGWRFVKWTGDCHGRRKWCDVVLDHSRGVVAHFERRADVKPTPKPNPKPTPKPDPKATPKPAAKPRLTANVDGAGTVTSQPAGISSCSDSCTASFDKGMVTLTATADPGSDFTEWTGACAGASCRVDLQEDAEVTAHFAPQPTLTTTTSGVGAITPDCPKGCREPRNAPVTLTASRDAEWAGCTPAPLAPTRRCTVTMAGDRTVSATFGPDVR
jgi:List-Bact-rpt repeat protein